MARPKAKQKEPVRLREKELTNGNKSLYLDIYRNGKRAYEFLKLYLVPERTPADKARNAETLRLANVIKSQRIIELESGEAGVKDLTKGKILLVDWIRQLAGEKEGGKSDAH